MREAGTSAGNYMREYFGQIECPQILAPWGSDAEFEDIGAAHELKTEMGTRATVSEIPGK